MFDFKVKLSPKSKSYLRSAPGLARRGAVKGMKLGMLSMEAAIKKNFGISGLRVRSGTLKRSVQGKVTKAGTDRILGIVGSSVKYSAIHEVGTVGKGGEMPDIVPKTPDGYLIFQGNKGWIKTQKVSIKARPYMLPNIMNNFQNFADIISNSIVKEVMK